MKVGDKIICLVDCAGEHIGMSEGEEYNVTEHNIEEMEDAVNAGHAMVKQIEAPMPVKAPKRAAVKVEVPVVGEVK